MTKFSVRKPLTILVAVVIVLVLGAVSLSRMTPDLLPNMDMPYVVVVTPYFGATPEKVENEVTRPLEQSMATLDSIQNITSSSSANASMIFLEFTSDVNMDTISVDIVQLISQIEGSWDVMVGTPYLMKINPSMLPVMVAAVTVEGMSTPELSRFLDDTLMNRLEGINGVASISVSGAIEEKLYVELSPAKIRDLNTRIANTINGGFDEAVAQMEEGRSQLQSSINQLENQQHQLQNSLSEMNTNEGADLAGELDSQMVEMRLGLVEQMTELSRQLSDAQLARQSLAEARQTLEGLQQMTAALQAMETTVYPGLAATYGNVIIANAITAAGGQLAWDAMDAAARQPYIDAELATPAGVQYTADKLAADTQLTAMGVPVVAGDFDATILAIAAARTVAQGQLAMMQETLAATLTQMGYTVQRDAANQVDAQSLETQLDAAEADLDSGVTAMEQGIEGLGQLLSQLEAGEVAARETIESVTSTMETLMTAQMGSMAMSFALSGAQLQASMAELDAGMQQLEQSREEALKSADLNTVLTIDVLGALFTAQNFAMPVGYVNDKGIDVLVSVGDTLTGLKALEDLILVDLGMEDIQPVYLRDIADVTIRDNAADVYGKINGEDGVLLTFNKQSTFATATTTANIAAKFDELSAQYEGLRFVSMMDQGDYIHIVMNSIFSSLLWGALFAVIILFLFLRDLRPTLITLCSIPISVLCAMVLMYFSGITLNIISLSGLAVAVGMLVDNSVVVIENVYRLRALGENPVKAAVSGAIQVAGAIAASTLTTVCVFLPIVFVEGITRQLFTDMALTLAYSLMASLVVALTLVPAMSSRMLNKVRQKPQRIFGKMLALYRRSLKWTLRHKATTLLVVVALLIASIFLVMIRGFSFMPSMEMPQLTVALRMDEDTTMDELRETADFVQGRIAELPGVETVGGMAGGAGGVMLGAMGGGMGGLGIGGGASTNATIYVLLDEAHQTGSDDIAAQVNEMLAGMPYEVSASSESGMSMNALSGSGVTVRLYGIDYRALQDTAKAVAAEVAKVPGTAEVSDGIGQTSPELRFTVNKDKAMKYGLTTAQVFQELAKAITTERTSTSLTLENGEFDIIVVAAGDAAVTPEYLRHYAFPVKMRDGTEETVRLADIASIEETDSGLTIRRENQRRYIEVTSAVAEGYNVTLVAGAIQDALRDYALPAGIELEYAGENEDIMASFGDLIMMLLLGVLLVYLVMVAQFQSLKSPFIVMFTIPLAFTGGFFALLITGFELSVIALIGFVMLVGIIVNNGIVLVDYINQLRAGGAQLRDAVVESGVTRMRPVLMTSITTILGLIVMALGVGIGSSLMQPIAIVCIGGLTYATLMTLYVVPVMYEMFTRKKFRVVNEEDLEVSEK